MVEYTPHLVSLSTIILILILWFCCRKKGCAKGICKPKRAFDRQPKYDSSATSVSVGEYELIHLTGAGSFISAFVWKKGSDKGLSCVKIRIDNDRLWMINYPFAKGPMTGMDQHNPSGIASFQKDDVGTVTIGFSTPLAFKSDFKLILEVKEPGIEKVISEVFYGEANWPGGPGDPTGDPGGELP